jgi:hypothetical protein
MVNACPESTTMAQYWNKLKDMFYEVMQPTVVERDCRHLLGKVLPYIAIHGELYPPEKLR